jgi:hypothetical protein
MPKTGRPYEGETDPKKIKWTVLKHLCIAHLEYLFNVNNIPIPEKTYIKNTRSHLLTQFVLISDEMKRKERMQE